MTPGTMPDLTTRVTWAGAWTMAALGAGAWWLAGLSAAAGGMGGGLIGIINFRWLARDLRRGVAPRAGGEGGPGGGGRGGPGPPLSVRGPGGPRGPGRG